MDQAGKTVTKSYTDQSAIEEPILTPAHAAAHARFLNDRYGIPPDPDAYNLKTFWMERLFSH